MGRIMYYFVNETHKEFCVSNHRVPVYEELNRAIDSWPRWASTDRILIQGQEESKPEDFWDHLTMNLKYTDLDYAEHMGS